MRIAVVSAHYPPDFVSGGTLVPQRLARGMRDRGHEVQVYAGSLNASVVAPWDDVDETGLPVRWIPVREAARWTSPSNWANPVAAADFASWLAAFRPEVVHLHALQALGGELVRIAKESGARTVVTMHDFWWFCGRQFLVDKGFRPCSLVVQAGVCGCEKDRSWLDVRNASMASALALADVVCVPSAIARDVAAANGLAPGTLVVDENGLSPSLVAVPSAGAGASVGVRFLYAGGKNKLKGVRVVLDAAALLGAGDWSLTAYGAGAEPRAEGLPVSCPPPYQPSDLSAVLQAHDVLVIPSVMRETYSILTREALVHGLAVVTSDSLGPEEVVQHGINGLVVTTGDPADLASAMRSLVEDPALLARLRSAAAPSVRTLEDQVDGLERMYSTPSPVTDGSPIRSVLFVCGIEGAPLRYRARLPAEALALQGISSEVRHFRDPELPSLAAAADALVVYRVPATTSLLALIGSVREGVPVLFDVDDLIVDPDLADEIPALRILPPEEAKRWLQGVHRYRTTLEACDGYLGSTQLLCDHIGGLTGLPTYRFSNGVGLVTARRSDQALRQPRKPGPLRIGYFSGTTTHDRDWQSIELAVLEVLAQHPTAELWLVGHLNPTAAVDALGDRLVRLPLQDWRGLPALLRDLDVNLAPLELDLGEGGRFNEAKSAIKHLEAALVATPTIATPTQPFREAITPDVSGFLASTHEEWVKALDALLSSCALRARLGARARRDALLTLSPHLQGQRYLAILEQARVAGRVARASSWAPVALDSPPTLVVLEPYTAEPVKDPPRVVVLRGRAAFERDKLRALVERDGVAGIAGALWRRARRLP